MGCTEIARACGSSVSLRNGCRLPCVFSLRVSLHIYAWLLQACHEHGNRTSTRRARGIQVVRAEAPSCASCSQEKRRPFRANNTFGGLHCRSVPKALRMTKARRSAESRNSVELLVPSQTLMPLRNLAPSTQKLPNAALGYVLRMATIPHS